MSILAILEELNSDTKRSHKTSLIEKYKTDNLFMDVVQLALNPYINFYIRKIPKYVSTGSQSINWALKELKKLSDRELTGNAGIEHLRSVLSALSSDDAIVIERIIGKDLRCGVADATINAVVDKFIPTYPCLLARPYDTKNIKNITYPAFSELKADGLRVNFHIDGNKVSVCGRSGRAIDLLGLMDDAFAKLGSQYDYPVVFDGELVVVDENNNILPRKIGNGIINKAIKGTITEKEAKMVRAQLWDIIPLLEFQAGVSKKSCKERLESLEAAIAATKLANEEQVFELLRGNFEKYWIIPYKIVNNIAEAEAHFVELLEQGEEGTILKNFCGLWEDTRSKHLVKMKAEKDCDLEIIGWTEGTGKFKGMVGSLQCASSDRIVDVNISGFPDKLRKEITNTIDELIGTIVAVKYNERITSEGRPGMFSLFLPRYEEFRTDKTVANSSNEIT